MNIQILPSWDNGNISNTAFRLSSGVEKMFAKGQRPLLQPQQERN